MVSKEWEKHEKGFSTRKYKNYEQYVKHQKSKLKKLGWIQEYDKQYRKVLNERIEDINLKGKSVLCLAARIGTEVKAFIDKGAFAVGIDLNPGEENKYVVLGDFHELQYADESVDIVFSNSIDHCLRLEKLLSETMRVLKKNGELILEIDGGAESGMYESFKYDDVDQLINLVEEQGFVLKRQKKISRHNLRYVWGGYQLIFFK